MKKVLFFFMLYHAIAFVKAQEQSDTIYFKSNRIEFIDSNFINAVAPILTEGTICHGYQKNNIYAIEVTKIDTTLEAKVTMLPRILEWCSRAKGYFYVENSLVFIDVDIDDFANITNSAKKFFYTIPKRLQNQEFCIIIIRFENNRWHFVEERQNY